MKQIRYQDAKLANKTSSKGNQGKYCINNEWIKTDNLGYEAAAEYLASEILNCSNIENYVSYSIEKIQIENQNGFFRNTTGCISKHFLKPDEEIITLDKFFKQVLNTTFEKEIKGKPTKEAISHVVDLIEKNTGISNFGQYLTSMFEFDAFILNEDRHAHNIALIYKNGDYFPAPIFDNGASFLSDTTQEYPMDEKTNKLISCVKAKPFNSSFEKQVKACQELYGPQISIKLPNISKQINTIKMHYGERIADRIEHIYNIQIQKNKELLNFEKDIEISSNIATTSNELLYTEQDMAQEITEYVNNGGNLVMKAVPENFVELLKEKLLNEEIPFIALRDKYNTCTIFTKDMDSKAFLKAQEEIFSVYKPPEIHPKVDKANSKDTEKILKIEDYDDL